MYGRLREDSPRRGLRSQSSSPPWAGCGSTTRWRVGATRAFKAKYTLELQNLGPVPFVLEAGRRIAQLIFIRMDGEPDIAYGEPGSGSHYQGQTGTTVARE